MVVGYTTPVLYGYSSQLAVLVKIVVEAYTQHLHKTYTFHCGTLVKLLHGVQVHPYRFVLTEKDYLGDVVVRQLHLFQSVENDVVVVMAQPTNPVGRVYGR